MHIGVSSLVFQSLLDLSINLNGTYPQEESQIFQAKPFPLCYTVSFFVSEQNDLHSETWNEPKTTFFLEDNDSANKSC